MIFVTFVVLPRHFKGIEMKVILVWLVLPPISLLCLFAVMEFDQFRFSSSSKHSVDQFLCIDPPARFLSSALLLFILVLLPRRDSIIPSGYFGSFSLLD